MHVHPNIDSQSPPDLSRWRKVPNILIGAGGLLALLGAIVSTKQFGFSWLLAFMFYLSLCLGALFLVMAHHLFDASWSVPIRRLNEQLACLLPVMALLFIPIAILAPFTIYPWMRMSEPDHALLAKAPLVTMPGFYLLSAFCLAVWWYLSTRLRAWSLKQDETGAAECTYKMRRYSAAGIFLFAITTTLAVILWMKALTIEWYLHHVWRVLLRGQRLDTARHGLSHSRHPQTARAAAGCGA